MVDAENVVGFEFQTKDGSKSCKPGSEGYVWYFGQGTLTCDVTTTTDSSIIIEEIANAIWHDDIGEPVTVTITLLYE